MQAEQTGEGTALSRVMVAAEGRFLDEHAEALLSARAAVEAVQRDCADHGLAAGIALARARQWPDVELVLLYADVIGAQLREEPDLLARSDLLLKRAQQAGDRATEAVALGLRAELAYLTGPGAMQEQSDADLAHATALLDDAVDGALTRVAGYIQCGLTYGQRELWELEGEMYALAHGTATAQGLPYQAAVVLANRAESLLLLACAQWEAGRRDELAAGHAAAQQALQEVVRSRPSPDLLIEAQVGQALLAGLVGATPPRPLSTLTRELNETELGEPRRLRGWLYLADALGQEQAGRHAEAARAASAALAELAGGSGSPPYLLALRLAATAQVATLPPQAAEAASAALRYAEHSTARRWQAHQRLLSSARARLAAERLRVDRDLQAAYAHVDDLTGLANRRGWTRALTELYDPAGPTAGPALRRSAVLFVDVDRFKPINDTWGHAVGDEVLARLARSLRSVTRSGDLTARLGGDEFAVLLPGAGTGAARARAREILRAVRDEPWNQVAPGLAVSVSIGAAAGRGEEPDQLLARADAALYRAKALGGDCEQVAADNEVPATSSALRDESGTE